MTHKDPEGRISLAGLQAIYPVSEATIWRKLKDPSTGFPKPIYVGRLRYWKRADVIAWLEAQAESTAA